MSISACINTFSNLVKGDHHSQIHGTSPGNCGSAALPQSEHSLLLYNFPAGVYDISVAPPFVHRQT